MPAVFRARLLTVQMEKRCAPCPGADVRPDGKSHARGPEQVLPRVAQTMAAEVTGYRRYPYGPDHALVWMSVPDASCRQAGDVAERAGSPRRRAMA